MHGHGHTADDVGIRMQGSNAGEFSHPTEDETNMRLYMRWEELYVFTWNGQC
jgi:hypothetical protein